MGYRNLSLIVVVIIILLIIPGSLVFKYATGFYKSQVVEDTVLNKERVTDCGSKSCTSRYLIYGQNETYEDTDSLCYGKFNSSDVYGHIIAGKKYKFTVIGWRNHFFSWYRDIVSVEQVSSQEYERTSNKIYQGSLKG